MFGSHEGGSKQKRRGTTRTRRVAAQTQARERKRSARCAGAGVASSLQCRYYDQ